MTAALLYTVQLRPIHSRRDADATQTPQSRDKIVLTFWSVPLFSRIGNSLLAVYRMRGNRAIPTFTNVAIKFPAPLRRSARVYYELASVYSTLYYIAIMKQEDFFFSSMKFSLPGVRAVHVRPQVGRALVRTDDGKRRDARALPPARRVDGPRGVQLRATRRSPPPVCLSQAALATHCTHQQPHCNRRRGPGTLM